MSIQLKRIKNNKKLQNSRIAISVVTMNETKSGEILEKWYSPLQVAKMVPGSPTPETVRNWAREGKVPGARQTPGKRWLIPASAIEILGGCVSDGWA